MFKHRLSKFGMASLFAACMFLVGGSLSSCEDDYFYDEREPEWLGASVYDFLVAGSPGHTYSCFVEIIDSLGEVEQLAHTGSKTLFVADDAAFEEFFKNNPWGVTSVSEMSRAQMKILLYNSMLDNAMLLDMLSSTGANTSDEGTCLRRLTSASIIDTVALTSERPSYNKFWDALRGVESENIRLAKDGTNAMMVHILPDFLKNNAVTASDINFLFRKNGVQTKTYVDNEALIFDKKLVTSGVATDGFSDDTMTITCKNGYIYRLDEVLLPPSNMAEELRKHEDTRIFSHLLDRFCIPVYDPSLTAEYQGYYKTNDTVFRLRYLTTDFTGGTELSSIKAQPSADEVLIFDPGWNEYKNSLAKERDMAAMFVPKDSVFYDYFVNGAGKWLIDQFAKDIEVNNDDDLMTALDCVPEVNIVPLLNNLMKPSFVGTVLSKFDKITDDANDDMGIREQHVDECVIANNGVIYILNNVFGPAEYLAVSAPTKVFDNMNIMRIVNKALKYNYYLLAMDAEFSFIVPDDSAFVYFDPTPMSDAVTGEMYAYHYDKNYPKGTGKNNQFWAEKFEYNKNTYQIVDSLTAVEVGETITDKSKHKTIFTDLMEYLIVVHDKGDGIVLDDGSYNARQYYQTKGYGTIKVDASDSELIKFYGGAQLERGTTVVADKKESVYDQKNGFTFCTLPYGEASPVHKLSGVPAPPTKSVYNNMLANAYEETDPFYEFYTLCSSEGKLSEVINLTHGSLKDKVKNDTIKLYSIFYSESNGTATNLVPFFNTYHYTVYVPSNNSIQDMYDCGLPSWDDILEIAEEKPLKATAMVRLLNRFLRYHFQDNSVYVDKVPFTMPAPGGAVVDTANFSTAVVNSKNGRFYETVVKSVKEGDIYNLRVRDQLGRTASVVTTGEENKLWNLMSRDIVFTKKEKGDIKTSSYAVIHPIDRVLLNESLFGYDSDLANGKYVFRRYADDGELVNLMAVEGSEKPFLVGEIGTLSLADQDGNVKDVNAGYLMTSIDESNEAYNAKHTREAYILDAEQNKILVTEEGLWVKETKDKNGKIQSYAYGTIEQDASVYMVRYNSDGTYELVKVGETATEEGENDTNN